MQTEGDVVRRPALYRKLTRHGMPKKKAKRIANKRSSPRRRGVNGRRAGRRG